MAGAGTERETERSTAAWKLVAIVVGVLVAVVLVVLIVLGDLLADNVDAEDVATGVDEGAVSAAAYDEVQLGDQKEDVQEALRPALPVDTDVLERYQQRSPETVAASCVFYEAAGGPADALYRFCFSEDRLVDKTAVLPDEAGVGG